MEQKYKNHIAIVATVMASLLIIVLVGATKTSLLAPQNQTATVLTGTRPIPTPQPDVNCYTQESGSAAAGTLQNNCLPFPACKFQDTHDGPQCLKSNAIGTNPTGGTTLNRTAPSTTVGTGATATANTTTSKGGNTGGEKFLTRCNFGGVTMTEGDYFNSTNTFGPPSCTVVINAACNADGLTLNTTETPLGCGRSGATPVTPANNTPAGLKSKVDSILNNVVPLFSQFKK